MRIRRAEERPPYDVIYPCVDNGIIVIPAYPRSYLLLDTPELVICNHLVRNKFTHYFFASGPKKITWGELPDDQKMTIRASKYGRQKTISLRLAELPYDDDRYYILEALAS